MQILLLRRVSAAMRIGPGAHNRPSIVVIVPPCVSDTVSHVTATPARFMMSCISLVVLHYQRRMVFRYAFLLLRLL